MVQDVVGKVGKGPTTQIFVILKANPFSFPWASNLSCDPSRSTTVLTLAHTSPGVNNSQPKPRCTQVFQVGNYSQARSSFNNNVGSEPS